MMASAIAQKHCVLNAPFDRRPGVLGFLRAAITTSEDGRTLLVLDGKAVCGCASAIRLDFLNRTNLPCHSAAPYRGGDAFGAPPTVGKALLKSPLTKSGFVDSVRGS